MDAGSQSGLFPSPTYSSSSMSSSNNTTLCTPENQSSALPSHDLKREVDIRAANARFLSATTQSSGEGENGNDDSKQVSLSAALQFAGLDSAKATMGTPAATQATTTMLGKRSGHTRNSSSISRRHSIQPIMPTADAEHDESQRRIQQGLTSSSPFGMKHESSFEDDLHLWQSETEHLDFDLAMSTMQSSDFLLSPPRLTVSLASQQQQQQHEQQHEQQQRQQHQQSSSNSDNDESKRRRTALSVTDTPQRPMSAQTVMQHTPPNSWTQMQAQASSIQSSAASSRISQTPHSMTSSMTSSSIFESGGSNDGSSIRRRSSISGDRISEIASLTAGLSVPCEQSPVRESMTTPQPMAAKMEFSRSATASMQSTKPSSPLERSDSKTEKSKGPDVWPDDVEVAFWEGEWCKTDAEKTNRNAHHTLLEFPFHQHCV